MRGWAGRTLKSSAVIAALLTGSALGGSTPAFGAEALAAPGPPNGFNWVLVSVTIPVNTLELTVHVHLTGGRAQGGPDATGVGTAIPHLGGDTQIFGNSVQPRLTTSSQAGAVMLSLDRVAPGIAVSEGGFQCACYFLAGDVARYLLFETDAAWTSVTADAVAGGVDAPFSILKGSGATAILAAAPDSAGVGATTPAGVLGSSTATATPDAGIVGGVSTHCLVGSCAARWHTPDGRSGGMTMTGNVAYADGTGRASYAGPRGPWSFEWSGLSTDPILAAYAPIGGLWPAFR